MAIGAILGAGAGLVRAVFHHRRGTGDGADGSDRDGYGGHSGRADGAAMGLLATG